MGHLKAGRRGARALVCAFAFALAGCASAPSGDVQQDAAAKRFVAKPDVASLYVYGDAENGVDVKSELTLDGKPLGPFAANRYYVIDVEPGRHTVTSTSENTDSLDIDAEAGQLYYVRQEATMGFLAARTQLHPVGAEEGKKGVLESRLAAAVNTTMPPPVETAAAAPADAAAGDTADEPVAVAAETAAPIAEPVADEPLTAPAGMPAAPVVAAEAAAPVEPPPVEPPPPAPVARSEAVMPPPAPIESPAPAPAAPAEPLAVAPPPPPPVAAAVEAPVAAPPPVVEREDPRPTVALIASAELHTQPRPGSMVTATLPAGSRVHVDPHTISNKTGVWCYVESGRRSGWILMSALPG